MPTAHLEITSKLKWSRSREDFSSGSFSFYLERSLPSPADCHLTSLIRQNWLPRAPLAARETWKSSTSFSNLTAVEDVEVGIWEWGLNETRRSICDHVLSLGYRAGDTSAKSHELHLFPVHPNLHLLFTRSNVSEYQTPIFSSSFKIYFLPSIPYSLIFLGRQDNK